MAKTNANEEQTVLEKSVKTFSELVEGDIIYDIFNYHGNIGIFVSSGAALRINRREKLYLRYQVKFPDNSTSSATVDIGNPEVSYHEVSLIHYVTTNEKDAKDCITRIMSFNNLKFRKPRNGKIVRRAYCW